LGHIAIGMLAGRALAPHCRSRAVVPMVVFSGISLLPDIDYLGVMLGVPDIGPCGHRGATHSLLPPLVIAAVAALIAPYLRLPRARTAILCGLTMATHALLDAMTVDSRGAPLLWPLSFWRFEMPWRPIPNAPCGLAYFSMAGLRVAIVELGMFMPILLLALWPGDAAGDPEHADKGLKTGPVPSKIQMTQRAIWPF
jgi:inner membrane protein